MVPYVCDTQREMELFNLEGVEANVFARALQ